LLSLPPELVQAIGTYLPLDGKLALKLAHPHVYDAVRLEAEGKISDCARLAIRSYLVRPFPVPTHYRCVLCKASYPEFMFAASRSPIRALQPLADINQDAEVFGLPPRTCCWHLGRMVRVVRTEPGGRNQWVSRVDLLCMHCGSVHYWDRCQCACDSCACWQVRIYTRFSNETECKDFAFWRKTVQGAGSDQGAQLLARETCSLPGKYRDLSSPHH
jgi:hypothetical protein